MPYLPLSLLPSNITSPKNSITYKLSTVKPYLIIQSVWFVEEKYFFTLEKKKKNELLTTAPNANLLLFLLTFYNPYPKSSITYNWSKIKPI